MRLVVADGVGQHVVFYLVRIGVLLPKPPAAVGGPDDSLVDLGRALGALDVLGNAGPRIGNVAALAEHLRSVLVGELDEVVIENLAVLAAVSPCPPAHPVGLERMLALHNPRGDVDVVDVLLHDVIARQPSERVLIPQLEFHFGLILARQHPGREMRVPINADRLRIADHPVVQPLERLPIDQVMMPL